MVKKTLIIIIVFIFVILSISIFLIYKPNKEVHYENRLLESITYNNISFCNDYTENSEVNTCIDEYYFYESLISRSNFCSEINGQINRQLCTMILNEDHNCETINDSETKKICNTLFDENQECQISNTTQKDRCTDMKKIIQSYQIKDPSSCDEIKNHLQKVICPMIAENS